MGVPLAGDIFGSPPSDNLAAPRATAGSEIDDPVGGLDDIEIVFDDQHRIACIHELVEDFDQSAHIFEVQSRGGLVEDIQGSTRRAFGEFARQFDPLGLASREGGGRLTQVEVVEAYAFEHAQGTGDFGVTGKRLQRFPHCQLEHVGDGQALVANPESGLIEPLALALFAAHENVGEKMHFDFPNTIALAVFAAPALDVEGEASGLVAVEPGFGKL